ncbi:uncharacterized protein LOC122638908 [Telopea speciosissima]|uniref:uncharacterized protein LOC122638908 n=1 Tax=Telopea speciosissima TaxID=54955 RepID=UPI001CC4C2B1|nr:uncharacterized protein LOC122638908 [Telopea speciosissima]
MALRVVMLVALLATSSVILSYKGVYGGGTSLTMEAEDVELERQLKGMNKPVVKSIKTDNGETYDCVDFYKQPAFNNPLLKNHIPEMSSSVQKETPKEAFSGAKQPNLQLDGGGCPLGTVPIRRTTKEDLLRWKSYAKPSGNFHQFLNVAPGTIYEGFALKDENFKYHGGSTCMSIHNPPVSANQYSGALMWVQGGQDQVQVGWHVNPRLYGDNKTHFFGYWTADDSQKKTGCFNAICNGFVQVNRAIPIGQAFCKTSTYGGEIIELATFLFQDNKSGNWWVSVGENMTNVGYWPRELFNTIKESAPVVGWRGEVYALQDEKPPLMGTGRYRYRYPPPFGGHPDHRSTAYFRAVRVSGEDYIRRGPNDKSLRVHRNAIKCYYVQDFPYIDDFFRHTFFYGGSLSAC